MTTTVVTTPAVPVAPVEPRAAVPLRRTTWIVLAIGSLAGLAMFSLVMAAEQAPSGTIKLTSKSVAIGVGVTWGDGTLTFGGSKTGAYPNGCVLTLPSRAP